MLINLIHRFNYPKTPFSVSENGVFHFVNLRFPFCIYHPTKTYSEYSLFAIGSIISARPPCLLLSWLKRGFESGRSSISPGSDCHLSRLPWTSLGWHRNNFTIKNDEIFGSYGIIVYICTKIVMCSLILKVNHGKLQAVAAWH